MTVQEEHALIFYGVSPTEFGHPAAVPQLNKRPHQPTAATSAASQKFVDVCDLTQTSDEDDDAQRPGKWSRIERPAPETEDLV